MKTILLSTIITASLMIFSITNVNAQTKKEDATLTKKDVKVNSTNNDNTNKTTTIKKTSSKSIPTDKLLKRKKAVSLPAAQSKKKSEVVKND